MGSLQPRWGFLYAQGFGYLPNTHALGNEEIDAYVLGIFEPNEKLKDSALPFGCHSSWPEQY